MIIDLLRLKSGVEKEIEINETYSFSDEYLAGTDVEKLDDVQIVGNITDDSYEGYYLNLVVSGEMIIPCAVTLKPVKYPFNIEIQGNLEEIVKEIDENVKNLENTIDILPIIWENILMEIPIKVVSEEAKNIELKGDGWRFVNEEPTTKLNPELQKLNDLLK